jgi:hypothetical protein
MRGTTVMGPLLNGRYVVDTGFASNFALLTKRVGSHRLSLRYDDFEVSDYDFVPLDDSSEHGHAWTVTYGYHQTERVSWRLEWLEVDTVKPSWTYFGLPEAATERMLQMRLSVRL